MLKRNRLLQGSLFLLALFFLAVGCKKEEQPPPAPPARPSPAAKPRPPVQSQQSSAKVPGNQAVSLEFTNRKDPFKPFLSTQVARTQQQPVAALAGKDLLPIQSYDLNKFKVAGIIVGLKENTALVIDPTGKGYVVKQGMLIGNGGGRISRISAAAIEVVEKYRDEKGRMHTRTSQLTLPHKK